MSSRVSDAVQSVDVTPRMRGVLHQWAFVVSLLAGTILVLRADTISSRTAAGVYALSLTACMGISAYYHRHRWSPVAKLRMQKLDHAMIFVMIAGTYTPIAAVVLPRQMAVLTLSVVWTCAVGGMLLATLWSDPPGMIEVGPYVVLGVAAVGLIPNLLPSLGTTGVALLAFGGVLYVVGALIYAQHRPDPWPRTFGFHEVFHVLVVLGACMHYAAISAMIG